MRSLSNVVLFSHRSKIQFFIPLAYRRYSIGYTLEWNSSLDIVQIWYFCYRHDYTGVCYTSAFGLVLWWRELWTYRPSYLVLYVVIKERLAKVAQLYSPTIADCIAEMLVYNVDDRIPVQDLSLVVYLNSRHEKIEKVAQ